MSDTATFSTHQHLESFIRGIQTIYEQSPNTSDLIVAGAFEACLVRISFLYDKIAKLEAQLTNASEIEKVYIEAQDLNLARISELESEIQALIERYA